MSASAKLAKPRYVIAVQDLERSARYYRDVLGFEVRQVGDPGWRFFVRDECFIMDIDAFHEALLAKNAQMIKPLRDEPWGMREFGIRTIDGHRIMFGSPESKR